MHFATIDSEHITGDVSVSPYPSTVLMPISSKACITSTSAGAAILNAIEARAVEMMFADGYAPEVFSSSNVDGGDEINNAFVAKYKKEIRSL